MYSEHRMMFTDEMIEFRQEKPPAILIAHVPEGPRNYDIIESCLKDIKNYRQKEYAEAVKCIDKNLTINNYRKKEYAEAVKCIDKNLTNKTVIFEDWSNIRKEHLNYGTVQLGNQFILNK